MQSFVRVVGLLVVCSILIGLSLFWYQSVSTQESEFLNVHLKGQTMHVMVANTPESRMRGLSGHAGLEANEGMLFIFPEDGQYAFWMKDMHFPIDIIWVSHDGYVVDIASWVSPDTYPTAFSPKASARYVLELPAGFAGEYGLVPGDLVEF